MNTTIKQKSVTLTPDDIHTLFNISEDIDNIHDDIAKCDAIADIFTEATARLDAMGQLPREGTMQGVANVICDYSSKANTAIGDAHRRLHEFYTQKRNESYGEVGVCNE